MAPRLRLRLSNAYGTTPLAIGAVTVAHSADNRTARIEPVTPIGDVYCTEPFASALVLDGASDLDPIPLGERELAKGFGTVRLYRLAQAG